MSKSVRKCKYKKIYLNRNKKLEEKFECTDEALDSGYCKLHDSNYLNFDTKPEVEKIFLDKIEKAIPKITPLLCIGYYLPSINISDKTFRCPVYFNETEFQGQVRFEKINFREDVNFERTVFKDNSSFVGSEFNKMANFTETKFEKEGSFLSIEFQGETNFNLAEFERGLFSLAKFQDVYFFDTKFKKESEFKLTKFQNKTIFQKSKFHGISDFTEARFKKETRFDGNQFFAQANFRKIQFKNPESITFNGNLSKLSFLETNISKVNFGDNVSWEKQYGEPKKFRDRILILFDKLKEKNNKFKTQDEWLIENNLEHDIQLETVMNVYRNLRENFDNKLRYDDAGQFFVREMELKRKFKKNYKKIYSSRKPMTMPKNIFAQTFSILAFYYFIAKYGESYYRPLKVVIPGLIFSTFYFWSFGFSNINFVFESGLLSDSMNNAVIRSLSAFFPFYGFSSHNTLSDLLLRIALLPISGTLFIALRRKLERKYRH